MVAQHHRSMVKLLAHSNKIIPVLENRVQLQHVMKTAVGKVIVLRHCNLLELAPLIEQAAERQYAVYVNIDHTEGVHADTAGLHYLATRLSITGILSTNPKVLALGKACGLETILRIFAADSSGLESALETVDAAYIDLLDVSPALAIPYIIPALSSILPLPFIGSGLITSGEQVQATLAAGAIGVALAHNGPGLRSAAQSASQ